VTNGPERDERPDVWPTILIAIGPVGSRIVTLLADRIRNAKTLTDDVLSVVPNAVDVDEPTLREQLRRLTYQSRVTRAEATHDLREPDPRTLRLRIVLVASVEEAAEAPEAWERAMGLVGGIAHNPVGLEVAIVLDAANRSDPDRAATGLSAFLSRLDERLDRVADAMRSEWGSAPSIRVFLAHPHRTDGSRLERKRYDVAPPFQAIDHDAPDEFEELIARVLEAHMAPGACHSCLSALDAKPVQYGALGGASAVFPRELLLSSVAERIAADILEETGRRGKDPDVPHPVPSRADLLAAIIERSTKRFQIDRPGPVPKPDSSLYGEIEEAIEGSPQTTHPAPASITVTMALSEHGDFPRDFQHWPAYLEDVVGRSEAEYLKAEQSVGNAPQGLADDIVGNIVRLSDRLVKTRLGGIDLARTMLEAAQRDCLATLAPGERTALQAAEKKNPAKAAPDQSSGAPPTFRDPIPPPGIEAYGSLDEKALFQAFDQRCQALPGFLAAVSRSVAVGSLIGAATAALTGTWLIGLIGMLVGGLVCLVPWLLAYRRLLALRDYVLARVGARFGRRLYDHVQRLIGHTDLDEETGEVRFGLIPAVWRYIEHWELPHVDGFDDARTATIERLRMSERWPNGYVPEHDLLDAEDVTHLYEAVRYPDRDPALRGLAESLLSGEQLFDGWRAPSLGTVVARCTQEARARRLPPYERGVIDVGQFREKLLDLAGVTEPRDRARWFTHRLDRMALRAVPLALRLDLDPMRRDPRQLLFAVPAGLQWRRRIEIVKNVTLQGEGGLPENSIARATQSWLAMGQPARVEEAEADAALAIGLYLFPGREAAMRAIGAKEDPSA